MAPRPRRTTIALAALLAGLSLSSCGGDEPDVTSFSAVLDQLPAPEDDLLIRITWADLEGVREANGLEVPDPDDADAVEDFVRSTFGLGEDDVVAAPPTRFDEIFPPSEAQELLGFTLATADGVASVGGIESELVYYAFPDDVEVADDLQDLDGGLFGSEETRFVGVDGSQAVHADDQALVEAWLGDDGDTMADDERVVAVAEALDDRDVVSALVTEVSDNGLVGFGWVDDDGDPAFVIVYGLGSDDEADDAVDRLREDLQDPAITDLLEIDDVEADGSTVVVTGHQVDDFVPAPLRMIELPEFPVR